MGVFGLLLLHKMYSFFTTTTGLTAHLGLLETSPIVLLSRVAYTPLDLSELAVTQYTFQIEISDCRKLTLAEKFPIY